jgi:guanosine-3',5'-bis(diphosphate) 3'-pyrophosphohydrolase
MKRRRIALETLEIYAPIADRLGIGRMKKRARGSSPFPVVDPDAYQHALESEICAARRPKGPRAIQKDASARAREAKASRIFHTIRMKGLWSLHQKLKRKEDDITLIHDIAALRVIVPTIDDCYSVLGVIHSLWKPLPGEFKDYIAFPKPNGYQSLHTTVFTPEAGIVEMQVRTEEMHRAAQFGIASHMSYKRSAKSRRRERSDAFASLDTRPHPFASQFLSQRDRSEVRAAAKAEHGGSRWLTDLADAHARWPVRKISSRD